MDWNDASALLGPGVYLLLRRGRVVHVGRAKCLMATIAKHRELVGAKIPAWFPVQGVAFDEVRWRAGLVSREAVERLRQELVEVRYARAA